MSDKIMLWIGIAGILIAFFAIFIMVDCYYWGSVYEKKVIVEEENDLLIKDLVNACYMPRDCFESDQVYLEQFPGQKIPKMFHECLVYCYQQGGEYEFLE